MSIRYRSALLIGLLTAGTIRADDWPQWLGPKRDGIWREEGIIDRFPVGGPKQLWKKPLGSGYAGPAVAAGKVFVTDRVLSEGAKNPASPFDTKNPVKGFERVFCLDEKTGDKLWDYSYECPYKVSYASGPRCTPNVDGDRVYTLGAMGDLYCFNIADGKIVWERHFLKDYESHLMQWGFAANPLIDGDKIICLIGGSEDRMVVALDKKTGKEIWHALTTNGDCGYSPPMIYTFGGVRQLIIWHNYAVVGLNPETGKKLWQYDWEIKVALTVPTARQYDGDKLFLTAFYNGPLMLKVEDNKVSVVWKGKGKSEKRGQTDGIQGIISTPAIKDGYIYGVDSYGELRCLKADTGERLWMTMKATREANSKLTKNEPVENERWATAFLVENGNRFFLFNDHGELIIANLTPKGYEEIDRASILEPTNRMTPRPVVWTHPAFADKKMFIRNDKEIVAVSLAK